MEFKIISLLSCILITSLACYWVIKGERIKLRIFFIIFYFFLALYCGIGGTNKSANPTYMTFYYAYLTIITIVFILFKSKHKYSENEIYCRNDALNTFIDRYALTIIVIYTIINLLTLVYPSNRLILLIHPPLADINARLDFYREGSTSGIIDFAKILLIPFFYWALSHLKYRNVASISIILLVNMYIEYCYNSYMGREPMLVLVVIILMYRYNHAGYKKALLFIGVVLVPFMVLFFVQYSNVRVGYTMENISYSDAMDLLLKQESYYPLQFNSYYNHSGHHIGDYFEWLFLLPLPGFMKGGHGGTLFNELFTNVSSNKYSWESDFSIALPGLVGESIFIFKYFFFIHAIILSTTISIFIRYFEKYASFEVLFYYVLMRLSMGLVRSGTQGPFSFVFKAALYFIIIVGYIIKGKSQNYRLQ